MATTQRSTVVGVFDNQTQAQRAVDELKRMGFRDEQIGVVARDGEGGTGDADTGDKGTRAGEGAAIGAAAGAGVGALWALGIAAGLLPGIGPVIAGGIFASILASAAGGAAAASLAGALIGMGISEDDAGYYEGEFQSGRTLVTVRADGRYDEALAVLRRHGGYDRSTAGTAGTAGTAHGTSARTGSSTAAGQNVQLHEEELHARKQQVQTGEVRVHKEVKTEHRTIDVPVTREEVVIERHPAGGRPTSGADIGSGQEIRIPVKEEQVSVEKRPVVKEEVSIQKRQVQGTEQVSGTVRKEDVRVEKEGDVDVRDTDANKKNRGRGSR